MGTYHTISTFKGLMSSFTQVAAWLPGLQDQERSASALGLGFVFLSAANARRGRATVNITRMSNQPVALSRLEPIVVPRDNRLPTSLYFGSATPVQLLE